MPAWLSFVLVASVIAACAYLVYVILRPERF